MIVNSKFIRRPLSCIALVSLLLAAPADAEISFLNAWGVTGSGTSQYEMQSPQGIGNFTGTDNIVGVVDSGNNRILTFWNDGTEHFYGPVGSPGSGELQFNNPVSFDRPVLRDSGLGYKAVSFVSDTLNHRIQLYGVDSRYSPDKARYLYSFGSYGTGPGQFLSASGVVYSGKFSAVEYYDEDKFCGFHTNYSWYPAANCYPDVNIFVADFAADRIQKFSPVVTPTFGESPIHPISWQTEIVYQGEWGGTGSGDGQLDGPEGITLTPDGNNLYVVDSKNFRVQRFDKDGNYLGQFGSFGTGDGQFGYSMAEIAIAGDHIYVAEGSRVQRFSRDGVFEISFGAFGTGKPENAGDDEFVEAYGIHVSEQGYVFVTDVEANRVRRFFDPEAWTWGTVEFTNPDAGPTSIDVRDSGLFGNELVISTDKGVAIGDTLMVAAGGSITLDGGTLNAGTTDAINGNFAWLSGTYGAGAHIGTLSNTGGTLSLGNSPGLMSIDGDYLQGEGALLLTEIAGLNRAAQPHEEGAFYDAVDVTGTATLGGILDVDLLDGFIASEGDNFDILMAEAIIGGFATVVGGPGAGLHWEISYLTDEFGSLDVVRLTAAVPVPAGVWLFGSALGLLGRTRSRKLRQASFANI